MQGITSNYVANTLTVSNFVDAESHSKQRLSNQTTALQTADSVKHAPAIIHNPPLKIRPVDDPITWLKLIEGNKSVAINTLCRSVLQILRERAMQPTKGCLPALLAACNNDPARLAIVLQHAKTLCEKNQLRQDSQRVAEATAALEEESGPEINAGLNTAQAFAMYTSDNELLQQIRRVYYNSIISKRSLNALFNAMTELVGEQNMQKGMAVMQKALNEDLLSAYPSGKVTPQLSALMSDAALIKHLNGLFTLCRDFLKKIQQFVAPTTMQTHQLTTRVVNMTTSSFYLRELQRLNQDIVGNEPKHQVVFLNYYYALLKRLPNVLWNDLQQRNNTLVSILRFMEQLTMTSGDFQYSVDAEKSQEAIKNKLVMQAGVPTLQTETLREDVKS